MDRGGGRGEEGGGEGGDEPISVFGCGEYVDSAIEWGVIMYWDRERGGAGMADGVGVELFPSMRGVDGMRMD